MDEEPTICANNTLHTPYCIFWLRQRLARDALIQVIFVAEAR